ncbi:MAG: glucosaminidase domain-containing protein, partial [Acidimicrobiales bacterium]
RRTLSADGAAARDAGGASSQASAALATASAAVTSSRDALTAALDQLGGALRAGDAAAAAFDGPEGSLPDPTPTILGENALDPQQLAGWFQSSGYVAGTQASEGQLTTWYIEEGRAEGVRGDLAFAQAVLETGGFSSPDAIQRHNFAGIGHCDTCGAGWTFPSDRLGVRGQIQLLRAFATPGLTAGQLADPPVLPSLDPAKQYREGCCATWPSLTGVWATDPVYGLSILELYVEMLRWAAGRLP